MPQQEQPSESRLLSGGIDTDNAPFAVENGDVLNRVNLRALRQKTQGAGKNDWIPGNTEVAAVTAILPAGTNTLLGKCVDDDTACIYQFFFNSATHHSITEYNTTANTARIVLPNAAIIGGLGWTIDMFIDCSADDGFLYFVDGLADFRSVSLATTYSSGSPIPASQLTVVSEPGIVPPVQSRQTIAALPTTIQFTPVQFAYRFTLQSGATSVLSPDSLTALPARSSAVQSNADSGNAVTVQIPVLQKVPLDYKRVELVARYLESNTFFVIRRWSANVAADAAAVVLHNAGTTPLTLTNWAGATMEALSADESTKEFDATPRSPHALLLAANRVVLGDFVEGYDTPSAPAVTITQSTFTANAPSITTNYAPFVIFVKKQDFFDWYFAIIIRIGSKNYLLPKECSIGTFHYLNNQIPLTGPATLNVLVPNGVFNIPQSISIEDLIELKESDDPNLAYFGDGAAAFPVQGPGSPREKIVVEANGLTGFVSDTTGLNWYLMPWNVVAGTPGAISVESTDPTLEFGPAGQSRVFLSSVAYNSGIQYYDGAGRKSGVTVLNQIVIPRYDVTVRTLVEKIAVTVPASSSVVPDYADFFAYTLSKAGNATRFGMFFGGIVKALFKAGDGTVVFGDSDDLVTPPPGSTIYGIGVPIPKSFKYEYAPGDYMIYSPSASTNRAAIIGTYAGMIVLQFTNDGTMHTLCDGFSKSIDISYVTTAASYSANLLASSRYQQRVAFILISGVNSANNQFEVAAFGNITGSAGSKQFGNFFATGTRTINIYGDCHTALRTSNSGGGTGFAMSPHEVEGDLTWVNDLGRATPTDSVGQKTLINAVRWSNARIPGATVNGYGSFDANDIKTTDITAGAITALVLTTHNSQDGGQMLALCEHGSFSALVGQQQISSADGNSAFTAAATVIGDFNPLRGGWGCQSPRAVVAFEGKVWWLDVYKRQVIEFNESGAGSILFKCARMWDKFLSLSANPKQITAGVDSFTGVFMVSLVGSGDGRANLAGFTGIKDASDAVDGSVQTWHYDWAVNKWVEGYTSGAEFMRVGTGTYGWKNGKLWKEFDNLNGVPGTYYGVAKQAMLSVPFTSRVNNQPTIKEALTLKLLGTTAPATTRFVSELGTAVSGPYRRLASKNIATIMRNRVGKAANNDAGYNANSTSNETLKGDAIAVMLYWTGHNPIALSDATLVFDLSSGG